MLKKARALTRQDQPEEARGRAQDRRQVAGGQEHEVRYEAEKMDVSRNEVRQAVKSEGNSRKKVEDKLRE